MTNFKVKNKKINNKEVSQHRWRICPYGEHWVREHMMHINGKEVVRHAHCALNPSKKDQLYPDEILEIARINFKRLRGKPELAPKTKVWKFENRDSYDHLIRGWTRYWNEIFNPKEPLDPNFVKALIASESGFRENVITKLGKRNFARGLLQITDQTIKELGNEKGELKDHYVNLTRAEALNPSINICAAIRWLFRKKETASSKLNKEASWEEALMDYKALLTKEIKKQSYNKTIMLNFNLYLEQLRGKK